MRFVSVNKLKENMYLAKPLFEEQDRVLLSTSKPLNNYLIEKIKDMGLRGVYINDEFSKDIVIKEIISPVTQRKAKHAIETVDIPEIVSISKEIVKNITTKKNISLNMIDLRTTLNYTYRHSVNVAVLSTIIGMALNLDPENLEQLTESGLLHDIGKLKIDKKILQKPTELTDEEFEQVKLHPEYGYDLLKDDNTISSKTKTGVYFHHENVDGTGYPLGLKMDELYLFPKIIHVADVYDALINKRSYKEAYPPSEAIEFLMSNCDIMFDRKIVELFLKYVPIYPKGMFVELSNKKQALVIDNDKTHNLRPIVKLLDGTIIDLLEETDLTITGLDMEADIKIK